MREQETSARLICGYKSWPSTDCPVPVEQMAALGFWAAWSVRARAEIYLVFNGYLRIEEDPDLENSILDTLLRTKDIAFDQIEQYSVQSILRLGDRHDVRWTLIPWRRCLEAQASAPDEDVFNAPFMACLIEEGSKAGGGPDPWLTP